MSQIKKIIVWGKSGCPHCAEVKNYLEDRGYEYTSIDVENKDYLRDVLEIKYGVRHVPVVEVGLEEVFVGLWKKDFEKLELLIKN